MFNEATFRDIFFPSLGNINDYVTDNFRKYTGLDGNKKCCRSGLEVLQCN